MLDNLRNSNPNEPNNQLPKAEEIYNMPDGEDSSGNFLGMSAAQRFVIVILLFFLTCVLGSFGLILTEKVVLPIF